MKIRLKVMLSLASLIALLIGVEIVVQELVILPRFAELERADAEVSMKRIQYALDRTIEGLALTAADWSDWGELYQFMQNRNRAFVDTYTTPIAMTPLKLNMLMVADNDGNVAISYARDLITGETIDLQLAREPKLAEEFRKPLHGLLRTNLGVMMIATSPVLDGSGGGRSLGTVLMGRLLTPEQVAAIGTQAQAKLDLTSTDPKPDQPAFVQTPDMTQLYRTFKGIHGEPLMSLRVEVPREITRRGIQAVLYASSCLVVAVIGALALLMLMLNRIVLEPIARVTRHAVAIGEGKDLTARLGFAGSDELARLAREFDRMVERVAESRRQNVDQSFQAGFAELAKGVLHNLGNAMTPLGVRLASLAERLRANPIGEVQTAIGELGAGCPDAVRRKDLEEFVRLGCVEVATTLEGAQDDVAVLQRQTQMIQATLAEQVGAARNEHVIESVRLPELVAQSLEIVPDSCRQRLVLREDESLRKVGVVRVARTVLRLVLQNLIINAADAVRDAGRDRGELHLAAEIVRGDMRDELHLRCADDGVGIACDALTRVFEKGYSTKSPETNQGIGLHWCANSIASLGGRMWAASDGPGLGAALHVSLPLAAREAGSVALG
jgi:sensor domain CHASE-containing protein